MLRRLRAALATASTPPWRRAPLLLLRRPGVLATVAGATAVLVAAVAAVPLFLSSVGTASVTLQAQERCPTDTGATRTLTPTPADIRTPPADPFVPLRGALAESNWWARIQIVSLGNTASPEDFAQASLIVRDGAEDHVRVLDGEAGALQGLWISDRAAETTGLGVGDTATIGGVDAPVTAVYRDLSGTTVGPYWCSHADLLLIQVVNGDILRPPPVVLADRGTFAAIMEGLDIAGVRSAWQAPLGGDLTVADTEALSAELACQGSRAPTLEWCEEGEQPLIPRRQGGVRRDAVPARDDADFVTRFFRSALPFVTDRSEAIRTSVGSGIWPVATFAALAGVGLVAAAATLWTDRRRRDVVLLSVRGVSPAGIAVKAALELSPALAAGAAGGLGLAYAAVRGLGPSPVIESGALRSAAVGAAGALLLAAATISVVVAARVRASGARRLRRLPFGLVPWELALVWAAAVSFRRLGDWGVPVGRGASVSKVDVWGLLFPVLFLVAAVGIVARVLSLGLRPLRAASRTWPTALFLTVRRVARHRAAAIGLLAAAAVAAGVLGYAVTMNRSLDATLHAKSATYVGGEVALRVAEADTVPPSVAARSTEVLVHEDAWVEVGGEQESAAVRFVDPDTFARAAYWDTTFSGTAFDEILRRLEAPSSSGTVPGVLVGVEDDDLGAGPVDVGIQQGTTTRIAVERVADVESFPGMSRPRPTVFLSTGLLASLDLEIQRSELWVGDDRDRVLGALQDAGVSFDEIRSTAEVADSSSFVTISWTFGFMQSLGVAAGVLVVGGVAVLLDARRRERLLGHAFLGRMGLGGRRHRRALALELGASVVVGCWIGLAAAVLAAWLAHGRIDPVPTFRPDPLLRPAVGVVIGLALGSVLLCAVAAAVGQRRVERDDPVEVLRAGA